MNIICCVDDAPEKQGRYIMGIQIMGTPRYSGTGGALRDRNGAAGDPHHGRGEQAPGSICNRTGQRKILPDIVKMITDGDLASRVRDVKVGGSFGPGRGAAFS